MADAQIQLEGSLLLADPSLRDGVFDHSVVLLANHSVEDGAFGLILNRPTGHKVGHFLTDPAFAPLEKIPVHIGGPVSGDQLTFSSFSITTSNKLRWQIRLPAEEAIKRCRQPGTVVRAFVGYSGWSAGQLEGELRRKAWITARPDASLFGMEHDRSLWSEILRSMSPYHRILAESPDDPNLN